MDAINTLTGLAGQEVPVADLVQLNKALRNNMAKAASQVGTITQGAAFAGSSGSELAPLVPQSIQSTLDSATFTEQAIVFWRNLMRTNVTSTLHESAVVKNYGSMGMDPWLAEGGGGTNSHGDYERKIVKIKFLAERREITDVATMVGTVGYQGVARQALAQQTTDGTRALLAKMERSLFNADSVLSDLAYDGLYKQLIGSSYNNGSGGNCDVTPTTTTNYTDKRGAAVSPQDIIDILYSVFAEPNFGMVNKIYCDPKVFGSLVQQATAYGRFDSMDSGASSLVFGANGLNIVGPAGTVPIVACPLMSEAESPISADQGTAPSFAVATGGQAPTEGTANATTTSWTAAEAGTYLYKFVAVSDSGAQLLDNSGNGHSITKTATIANCPVFEFVDSTATATTGIRYYRAYRTAAGGAASTAKYIGSFPVNGEGSGTNTKWVDNNSRLPGSGRMFFLQQTPDVMYWAQLLDFMRRPLAQVNTTIPFLLMLFGSLHVKVPTKNWVLDNVGSTL